MKKYLFGDKKGFYKANLHAHSTDSDGVMPPKVMKEEFKKRGYDILCITEHEMLVNHSDFSDKDFLFINGFELAVNENNNEQWSLGKCSHLNIYAKYDYMTKTVCFNPDSLWFADEKVKQSVEYIGEIMTRKYTPENINSIIKTAKQNDFIVCLNHPTWSLEEPSDFLQYEGLFALEVHNTACVYNGWNEFDITAYDLCVRHGKKISLQMADDNHNCVKDDYLGDTFGGFDIINCDKLDYNSVITALENGDFYGSQAPEIKSITLEGNVVTIETSPARSIILSTGIRYARRAFDKNDGEITCAQFEIDKKYAFIRFEVIDENNKHAFSRAYFTEDIL